jgi:hypothetical protein
MKLRIACLWVLLVVGNIACTKKSPYPIQPVISNIGITPTTVKTTSVQDTLFITFRFTDGDGDIGNSTTAMPVVYDIYLIDSRYDSVTLSYFFPNIPSNLQSTTQGLAGLCMLSIPAPFIPMRSDSTHTHWDTVHFCVYMIDRAGHHSDTLTTQDLYLKR